MRNLFFLLLICPFLSFGNDKKISSKIKEVTVYLGGAHVTRTAECNLPYGRSEIILTGLSTKIDESSIQISGLRTASILSMSYDINYLVKEGENTESLMLQQKIDAEELQIALLKNRISGLEEEEQIIRSNRSLGNRVESLNLDKIKEVSMYYRQRITAIKDEIFKTNQKINSLHLEIRKIQKQLEEMNNLPEKEQGEIKIKFDSQVASRFKLTVSYQVSDAGWIPNYDIKSSGINNPLSLGYKAYVYQKTGTDWNNVNITLSTGSPNMNVSKPNLGTKYLNFTNSRQNLREETTTKKQRYVYNPTVRQVTGTVSDESGAPLPGASIVIKGTSKGTQTDFDGYFTLDAQNGRELVVSYIGFETEELPIYSSIMNIRLNEDTQVLDEVVVTGYGNSSKNATTGAVSSVSAEQVLQGKVAGLHANSTSFGIKLRGISKIRNNSNPLYVIDGIIVSPEDMAEIDPTVIASVEVLKGTNANVLYGSRGANGVIVMTTQKSNVQDEVTNTKFVIKKPHSIVSDGDVTVIEINRFMMDAQYEYYAAPIVNENVFLTAKFKGWEKYHLLPGEASIYFKGTYAGKTSIDPYTTNKEMTLSLGVDPNITVTRKQNKNFKSKSFMGNNRILDRTYDLEVKNNKVVAINLRLMDRIPISQNKEIKVDNIEINSANYENKKGLLVWNLSLKPQETRIETFSFQIKYPKYKQISL